MTPVDKKTGERIPRKDRIGIHPVKAGVIALIVLAIVVFFGFTKHIPFTHGYQLKAVFEEANSIRLNSPVRIAGVNVGKVTKVEREPGTTAAILTMDIKDNGLPVHKDATLKIRPRIFLEGNFFVDLKPGTPSSPTLDSGSTVPVTQTATPVQLDQILTSLQSSSREDLQNVLAGLGVGLTHKPTAEEDATQDPDVQGKTAAEALNQSFKYGGDALRNTAEINEAFLGTEAGDLSKMIAGLNATSAALDANQEDLQELIVNFDVTMGAFASESSNLRASVRELGPTVKDANSTLTNLNATFPSLRAFALEAAPGIEQIPATIDAADPFIPQAKLLVSQQELGGLAAQLKQSSADLSQVVYQGIDLFHETDLISRCADKIVLPAGEVKLDDGDLSSGVANYKEFFYSLVGQNGEGQSFDGNGQYLRLNAGGGDVPVHSEKLAGRPEGQNQQFGNAVLAPLGTRPKWPNKVPAFKTDRACYKNTPPDLNGPAADAGPPSPAP